MRAIKSKNTQPELIVRSIVHRLGYRFRLHRQGLPGKPDLVFPRLRKAVFVHGCFWHQHPSAACKDARPPKSNGSYWVPKLARTKVRDAEHLRALSEAGWGVAVIWECETKAQDTLAQRIAAFIKQ
jgi:DNA mismatch endonuclease (patch repair protein)